MSKQIRLIIITSVVVVIAALGYFVALPQVQAGNYTSTVKTKYSSLSSEAAKLNGLFELDLFTKTDQTADEVRVDVKNATEVLDAVKEKLSTESDSLTQFTEYPLLTWHPAYKDALDLNKLEKTYVGKAKEAVKEFEAVIEYFDDSADIQTRVEAGTEKIDSIATLSTMDEIITLFEKVTKTMQEAVNDLEKLTPPESLKEFHTEFLAYNKEGVSLFKQFVAALKAEDAAKINELGTKITEFGKKGDAKSAEFSKKFVEQSSLRKLIDQLLETDKDIKKLLG